MHQSITHRLIEQYPDAGQILTDLDAAGRDRPWRDKRLGAEAVASAYRSLGHASKAQRCSDCGTTLIFAECPSGHTKHLRGANFCRIRLCPMCAWRRSLKYAAEVSAVLHVAAASNPRWTWVMLTLTVRNVPSNSLKAGIDQILHGWEKLSKRRSLHYVAGWLRTLEITRNNDSGEWHPHIHALLAVKPSYWKHGYISQARWRQLWAEACGLDYLPVVEVHRVRQRHRADTLGHVAAEVGKYAVKDSDLVSTDQADTIERVRVLDAALRGRRLIAWGGELRKIARQVLRSENEGAEDLVHLTGEIHGSDCPVCGMGLVDHVYKWAKSLAQYVG